MELSEILGYLINFGLPIVAVLITLFIMILSMAAAAAWTRYIVLVIVLIVLLIPQASSYGSLDGGNAASSIFWTKGTKSFFFSFFEMALFSSWLFGVAVASNLSNKRDQIINPLSKWYIAFGILFFGYIIFALFEKSPLILEFANMGVINILKQGMLISLLFVSIQSERDLRILTFIILCSLAGREAWGLIRYLFLGGDPQNVYANVEFINVKITFFDVSDSTLSSLMLGITVWKVLTEKLGNWQRVGYLALATMALLTPILTSRRICQSGVLMAMLLLAYFLPKGRRFPVVLIIFLAIPIAFSSIALRSSNKNVDAIEKVLIDVKKDGSDPRLSRFYELETAWQTIKEKPVFGVGPSGQFKVTSSFGLEYHKGNYGFVHSGFAHVLLKTGFVGLFIFIGIFITFLINIKRRAKAVLPEHKALFVGSMCAFVAEISAFLFGAPIIEIRTMLVGGFLFAIPLICIAIGEKRIRASKVEVLVSSDTSSYFYPTEPNLIKKKNNV